uniref:Cell division protein n=1 Tax=Zygnema circumcarinatum TaxID=35869 RepID=Q32RH1_ZYGCR|nr:cell division protein [Zygnema circumcarinatum]AAX45810.1 cell division protein [Zygnema circumcarinatum]
MKLNYILRSLSPDWKIRNQNTSMFLSNFTNKYHVFKRGGLMRSNKKNSVIYSLQEITNKEIDIVARNNLIVNTIYYLNSWSWIYKIRNGVLREFQANLQIRESIWPWINLHIYSAIRGSIRSRYNVNKLVSSSCLIYLTLLDLKDGLYELFSALQNAFNISGIINGCVKLIRITVPTLSIGPKNHSTLKRISTSKPNMSLVLSSRPKTRDIINTVALLSLPLAIYRIHPKFNYLINNKINLDQLLGANHIHTSNIWSNYVTEPRQITSGYDEHQWFEDTLSVNNWNISHYDSNCTNNNHNFSLVLNNSDYFHTIITYSQRLRLIDWNNLTTVKKHNDITRAWTWWKWYCSSMYQQIKHTSRLSSQSERICTHLDSMKGFKQSIIDYKTENRSYSINNLTSLSLTLNPQTQKDLGLHQTGWVKQLLYDNHQIHITPLLKGSVSKHNQVDKFNNNTWWSGVLKLKHQITQVNSISQKFYYTTYSIVNNIQYWLNINPINLFKNRNISRLKQDLFNNKQLHLSNNNVPIVVKFMQLERERTLFRQKVTAWKLLSQQRNSCQNQTCLWNVRNSENSAVKLSVLKPKIEVSIVNLLRDNTSIAQLVQNLSIYLTSQSLRTDNQLLVIQSLYSKFITFVATDTVHKKWNIYPFKKLLYINEILSSNCEPLYILRQNKMVVKPLLNLVATRSINNYTHTINKSDTFEQAFQRLNQSSLHTINIALGEQIEQFQNNLIQIIEQEVNQNRIRTALYTSLDISSFEINQIWNKLNPNLYFKGDWFLNRPTYVRKFIETCSDLNLIRRIKYKIKMQCLFYNINTRSYNQKILIDKVEPIHQHWYFLNQFELKQEYSAIWNNLCSHGVMLFPYKPWQQVFSIPTTSQYSSNLNHYGFNRLCTDTASHLFWGTIPSSKTILPDKQITDILDFKHQRFAIDGENKQTAIIRPNTNRRFIQKQTLFSKIGLYDSAKILQIYNQSCFTLDWWNLVKRMLENIIPIIWQQAYDGINRHLLFIKHNRILQHNEHVYSFVTNSVHNFLSLDGIHTKSIYPILEHMNQASNNCCNLWSAWQLIQHPTANEYATLAWLGIIYVIYFQFLSIYTGLAYISVWNDDKKVRHLLEASWNTQLDLLVYKNTVSPLATPRWESYCSQSEIMLIRGRVYSKWITNTIIAKWLLSTSTLDLSVYNKEKGIIEQCLVSREALIKFEHRQILMSSHRNFNDQSSELRGLNYLRELTQTYFTYPINMLLKTHPLCIYKSIYYVFDSVTSSWFNSINATTNNLPQFNDVNVKQNHSLIPVELEHARPIGLLLIGNTESGKSYLAKSLAANANVPIVRISVDSLISIQSDLLASDFEVKIDLFKFKLKGTKSLKKLAFMLDLAMKISPCIVWIPDIHKLCLDPDPMFQTMHANALSVLTSLLTTMNELYKHYEQRVLFVGSTNNTKQLDPVLITPMRFNKLIYLRMPSQAQRTERLLNLLRNNGIQLKNRMWLAETRNRTIGYSWRDLSGLINETLLIHSTQVTKYINTSVIRLALHRQIFGIDNTRTQLNNQQYSEDTPYKIGKAIIHSMFLNSRSMHPLYIRQHLWKTRFYILSRVCLEPNPRNSSITELVTLPYIFNCLAGSAGRDAWIISTSKVDEYSLSLSNQVKHDLSLASSLFEALFVQLAFPNIYAKRQNSKHIPFLPQFSITENMLETTIDPIQQTNDTLFNRAIVAGSIITKSISERLGTDIHWSFRTKRFDLYRSSMFKVSKLFINPATIFVMTGHGKTEQTAIVESHQFEYSPYERRMLKVQQQQENNIQVQFNARLFKQRAESMGLPIIYTDLMEHEESRNPIFFIGGRPMLDLKVSSLNSNVIFSRRHLLANTDLLTMLHGSYGAKRNIDKPRLKYSKPPFLLQHEQKSITYMPKISKTDTEKPKNASNTMTFDWFRTIVQSNSYLQRPQLSFRVYSYQSWTSQSTADSLIRLDSFYYQQIIQRQNRTIDMETLVWRTIVETYLHLFNMLLYQYMLLATVTDCLLQQDILFSEHIRHLYQYALLSLEHKHNGRTK